jgi:hypothetical protein
MNWRHKLFRANCGLEEYTPELLEEEISWIKSLQETLPVIAEDLQLTDFEERLWAAVRSDVEQTSCSVFVAEQVTFDQLASIVRQYAVDGLTEAEAMFYAMPRMSFGAKIAVTRILIDEFGCGNPRAVHQTIYSDLMTELGLTLNLETLLPGTLDSVLDFVNVYHYLTRRARTIDMYLGGLAYTEAIIPYSFQPLFNACERLGVQNSAYFSEHIHIDEFHAKDAVMAIRKQHSAVGVNAAAASNGVQIVRHLGTAAFEAVVNSVRPKEVPCE